MANNIDSNIYTLNSNTVKMKKCVQTAEKITSHAKKEEPARISSRFKPNLFTIYICTGRKPFLLMLEFSENGPPNKWLRLSHQNILCAVLHPCGMSLCLTARIPAYRIHAQQVAWWNPSSSMWKHGTSGDHSHFIFFIFLTFSSINLIMRVELHRRPTYWWYILFKIDHILPTIYF